MNGLFRNQFILLPLNFVEIRKNKINRFPRNWVAKENLCSLYVQLMSQSKADYAQLIGRRSQKIAARSKERRGKVLEGAQQAATKLRE